MIAKEPVDKIYEKLMKPPASQHGNGGANSKYAQKVMKRVNSITLI